MEASSADASQQQKGEDTILSLRLEKQGLEEKINMMKKRKRMIMKTLGRLEAGTDKKEMEKEKDDKAAALMSIRIDNDVKKALKKGICTFCVTGTSKLMQESVNCITCQFTTVCKSCATRCHSGHNLRPSQQCNVPSYCDCGANPLGDKCKSKDTAKSPRLILLPKLIGGSAVVIGHSMGGDHQQQHLATLQTRMKTLLSAVCKDHYLETLGSLGFPLSCKDGRALTLTKQRKRIPSDKKLGKKWRRTKSSSLIWCFSGFQKKVTSTTLQNFQRHILQLVLQTFEKRFQFYFGRTCPVQDLLRWNPRLSLFGGAYNELSITEVPFAESVLWGGLHHAIKGNSDANFSDLVNSEVAYERKKELIKLATDLIYLDIFYEWHRTYLPIVDNINLGHLGKLGQGFVAQWQKKTGGGNKSNLKYQKDLLVLFDGYHKRLQNVQLTTDTSNTDTKTTKGGKEEAPIFVFGATTSAGDEVAVPSTVAALFNSVETASFGGRHPMLPNAPGLTNVSATPPTKAAQDEFEDIPDLIDDEGESEESDDDMPPLLNPDDVSSEEDDDMPPLTQSKKSSSSTTSNPSSSSSSPSTPAPTSSTSLYGEMKSFDIVDTHAQYSRVLLKFREGRWDEALGSLYVAFFCNPHVVYYLTSKRTLPPAPVVKLDMLKGSDEEATVYAQNYLRYWQETDNAILWLTQWVDSPCTPELSSNLGCVFHQTCETIAGECKNVGNDFYNSKNDYQEALLWYHRAMAFIPWEGKAKVVLYSNFAQALLKLERFEEVIQYSNQALALDPNHARSLWRRAVANENTWRIIPAIQDLLQARKLEDKTVDKEAIKEALARLRKIRFCLRPGCGKYQKPGDEAAQGKYKKCGNCRLAHYCSRECQAADWKREGGHKVTCGKDPILDG